MLHQRQKQKDALFIVGNSKRDIYTHAHTHLAPKIIDTLFHAEISIATVSLGRVAL